ncbi:MAG: RHS repeat-associated core domain-containing protein [Bacteroides sp.]|nr:RHS repeat-associated core domain-containing protein [Bacteroides sp.]
MLNSTATGYVDHISYHDGLGRPFQTVEQHWPSSGSASTLVTQQEYDLLGRPSVSRLPLPGSSSFVSPNSVATSVATHYGDSYAYSTISYDSTARERVVSEQGEGSAWQGKVISTEYLSSGTSGDLLCQHYKLNTLANVTQNGAYAAGALQVVKTTDEDGKVGYTFTDKQGRTVLERRVDGTTSFDTYYVYDDYGNLECVLPPAIDGDTSTANMNRYAYLYRYNERNLCTWKKLPGVEPVEYVYDEHDRMVFSQDGNQRVSGKWTFYVYDNLNRLVQQGENTSKTVVASDVYIQNYYDDHDFVGTDGFTDSRFNDDETKHATGSLTGTVMNVLGSNDKIYTAYYYDIKGRVTKKVQSNQLGGYDVTTTTYTFTGNPATVTHEHTANGKTTRTEVYTYTYDHADRLSSVKHKLGSTEVTLASYTYDSLGRQSTKKLHGSSTNQLTYTYNIRNWLSGISGSKFNQNLYYTDGNGTACYNGNISSMTWKSGDETTLRGYKYTYDGLDRLKTGIYGEGSTLSTNVGRFTESVGSYDKNGNIMAGFVRSGLTSTGSYANLNALTITLNGNQIQSVTDHVPTVAATGGFEFVDGASETIEYTYDNNGNLTKDSNKGISNIAYNVLNLPSTVTFSDGSTITYSYAADGTKLRTVHTISGTVTQKDYCANVVYENGIQKMLLTEEGYVDLSASTPAYYYYLKDHQGNNRVVLSSGGTAVEVSHYYPFGGVFASTGNVQPYKYNGKELDTKKGLNWYDYGARHYDAALGRWLVVDPLAEKYYSTSAYGYCLNNPVKYVDPTGCAASTHTDSLGTVVAVYNDGDLGVYKHNSDKSGTQQLLAENYSSTNTSANGEKMGETYEWNSFVNPGTGDPIGKINFGSTKAAQEVFKHMNILLKVKANSAKLLLYAFNANNGELFDIKHHNPYLGSQFALGKYVSMRDAGNILAGMVARTSGLPAITTYTAFGALQLSGNNRTMLPLYLYKAYKLGYSGSFGELPISHSFQRRGYELNFK